ncbi:MAG: FAD-binding protein [Phycisphaerae bacterium]|nr:FAD-binding protein [Phycisphaerae bacterium]MDD5380698.1 FAD-binding protein [Phycisphaerae bacterium]
MSNYIVLTKQVPDITQITDNAFDPETGTLIRSRLVGVINELDTQALAFANYMKTTSGDADGRIVALTMGPPMAEEVLRYTLARCADMAVLLTDKALGGADTWATANPLAYAIRRIAKDFFNGNGDYYVVCGMQSVDGDTAQVPPQIAEELSLPCVAYATKAEFRNGRFEFTRIISGGSQVVAPKKLPAVITVAKYEYPLFATFVGTRRANRMKVVQWSGDDIKAAYIGAKGSKTSVIRVFPPGKSTRKCKQLGDVKTLAKLLVDSFKSGRAEPDFAGSGQMSRYVLPSRRVARFGRDFERTRKENEDFKILYQTLMELGVGKISRIDESIKEKILAVAGGHFHKKALEDMINGLQLTEPSFAGEVWVVAEYDLGTLHPATFELIGKARELADSLETKVGVCLAGQRVGPMAKELIVAGADNIYVIEDELLSVFDPSAYCKAVADCISTYWPQIVLFAATARGRMLAPMVSYRVGCGLTADCTSFDIRDSSRTGRIAILMQTRPALGGNVMATICTKDSKSQMATVRPGVMKRIPPDQSRTGEVIEHKVRLCEDDINLEIIKTETGAGVANFNVEVIVSGGKGMQSRDNYERLVGSLCDCLSDKLDTSVERGASRAAVEQGFIERIHQVGQTGTSVGPKLYIALGVSGAIQHMIGVANAGTIIAINSDPNAPIFKQCDYYMVGIAEDIVPQLVLALKAE